MSTGPPPRALADKIGQLFEVDSSKNGADGRVTAASARDVLQNTVEAEFQRLTGRAASCLAALPYGSVEEARLSAEYEFLRLKQEAAEADNGIVPRLPNALGEKVDGLGQKVERLGQKAKKAEAKIEKGWEGFKERPLTVIKDVASYGQGVWVRLNGGGRSTRKGAAAVLDTLPAARSSKQEHEARMVSLALEAEEVTPPCVLLRCRPWRTASRPSASSLAQPLAHPNGLSVPAGGKNGDCRVHRSC